MIHVWMEVRMEVWMEVWMDVRPSVSTRFESTCAKVAAEAGACEFGGVACVAEQRREPARRVVSGRLGHTNDPTTTYDQSDLERWSAPA